MDSLSFVLGVKAMEMRGAQLRELIFNPTGKDKADVDTASVRLVLRKEKSGDELTFQRSVLSGKGGSEYRLDGKVR
jgi:structural maintenance of chromosome 1